MFGLKLHLAWPEVSSIATLGVAFNSLSRNTNHLVMFVTSHFQFVMGQVRSIWQQSNISSFSSKVTDFPELLGQVANPQGRVCTDSAFSISSTETVPFLRDRSSLLWWQQLQYSVTCMDPANVFLKYCHVPVPFDKRSLKPKPKWLLVVQLFPGWLKKRSGRWKTKLLLGREGNVEELGKLYGLRTVEHKRINRGRC